jgi:hypothetical protein
MRPAYQVLNLLALMALLVAPPHDPRTPPGYLHAWQRREMDAWELALDRLHDAWYFAEQKSRERRVMDDPSLLCRLPSSWREALLAYESRDGKKGAAA